MQARSNPPFLPQPTGVPQPVKTQPAAPWGNHTPAHPADYKTWGEPDEDPANVDRMEGRGGGGPNNAWAEDAGGGGAGPHAPWDADAGQ